MTKRPDPTIAKAPCGCRIRTVGGVEDRYFFEHCELHGAAEDLLAALKGVLAVADRETDEFDAARAAIEKAGRAP